MLEVFLYVLTVLALSIGSYTDFKRREVPDWISYGLIFSALGIRLIYSIFSNDYRYLLFGVEGFVFLLIISNILYYLKQWGGGDAKILMGIGAVIGLDIFKSNSWIHLGFFFLLLIFLGALYGIAWSVYLAIKNKSRFIRSYRENTKDFNLLVKFTWIFLAIGLLSLFVYELRLSVLIFGISFILFAGIYSFIFTKSVEESCMLQRVKAKQLTEGDWVMDTIKINGKTVISKDNLGITKEQIKRLSRYRSLILVKTGVPFIPAFLLAYITLIILKMFFRVI